MRLRIGLLDDDTNWNGKLSGIGETPRTSATSPLRTYTTTVSYTTHRSCALRASDYTIYRGTCMNRGTGAKSAYDRHQAPGGLRARRLLGAASGRVTGSLFRFLTLVAGESFVSTS